MVYVNNTFPHKIVSRDGVLVPHLDTHTSISLRLEVECTTPRRVFAPIPTDLRHLPLPSNGDNTVRILSRSEGTILPKTSVSLVRLAPMGLTIRLIGF